MRAARTSLTLICNAAWVIAGSVVVPLGVIVFKLKEVQHFFGWTNAECLALVTCKKGASSNINPTDSDPLLQPHDRSQDY